MAHNINYKDESQNALNSLQQSNDSLHNRKFQESFSKWENHIQTLQQKDKKELSDTEKAEISAFEEFNKQHHNLIVEKTEAFYKSNTDTHKEMAKLGESIDTPDAISDANLINYADKNWKELISDVSYIKTVQKIIRETGGFNTTIFQEYNANQQQDYLKRYLNDGLYGKRTSEWVKMIQNYLNTTYNLNLTVDGRLGKDTLKALLAPVNTQKENSDQKNTSWASTRLEDLRTRYNNFIKDPTNNKAPLEQWINLWKTDNKKENLTLNTTIYTPLHPKLSLYKNQASSLIFKAKDNEAYMLGATSLRKFNQKEKKWESIKENTKEVSNNIHNELQNQIRTNIGSLDLKTLATQLQGVTLMDYLYNKPDSLWGGLGNDSDKYLTYKLEKVASLDNPDALSTFCAYVLYKSINGLGTEDKTAEQIIHLLLSDKKITKNGQSDLLINTTRNRYNELMRKNNEDKKDYFTEDIVDDFSYDERKERYNNINLHKNESTTILKDLIANRNKKDDSTNQKANTTDKKE